jgi:hypothetical protein
MDNLAVRSTKATARRARALRTARGPRPTSRSAGS